MSQRLFSTADSHKYHKKHEQHKRNKIGQLLAL